MASDPVSVDDAALRAAIERAIAGSGADVPDAAVPRLVALVRLIEATPVGVTTVRDPLAAAERHVGDALRGLAAVDAAPPGLLADVGSGGGIPGLVLAAARPERPCALVESNGRKAGFLAEAAAAMGLDVAVHAQRSEEVAAANSPLRDACAVVVARALAAPPVAAELCLPLAAQGGRVVLWVGESADPAAVATAAARLGGRVVADAEGLLVLAKDGPTPAGFPRRPGMAAKRPLA